MWQQPPAKGVDYFFPLLEEVPQQGCLAPILPNFCSQSPLVIPASAFYDAFFLSKLTAQLEYIIQSGVSPLLILPHIVLSDVSVSTFPK